jgi:quercetin dioxygenase-like cupin family protein
MKPTAPPYSLDPEEPETVQAVQDALALALAPAPLPEARQEAIRRRLMERVRASLHTGRQFIHVPLAEGEWRQLLPGVRAKTLSADQRAVLLDLDPGASLPVHRHHEDEECVVLRGEASLGDIQVRHGDYHLARAGSRHGTVRSATGALLYLRGVPIGHGAEVLRDIVTAWLPGAGEAPLTLREGEGPWADLEPGVHARLLRDDGVSRSCLLRLDPGARLTRHHSGDEECLLVDGEAFLADDLLRPGDYHLAPAGTPDKEVHSDVGAVLFVRGASAGVVRPRA